MIEQLIFYAGIGQLILVIASLAIPRVLKWPEDTGKLRPLTRQVFWTYAGYIWATNLSFSLISIAAPESLTEATFLSTSVAGFITVYWFARVVIQFVYFDKSDAPVGLIYTLAEYGLNALFISLVLIYGSALAVNFGWISL